jgi:uncharacterized membrane protein YfcA
MLSIEWIILYGLLGSFVGFMAGLLGVGGGGILVPLLAMMFRYQGMEADQVIHYALGTAFGCMIFSSIASIRAHAAHENVVWKLFYGMAAGIMLGMFLTTSIASHIHSTYIAIFFAGFMVLTATQMFLNWKPKPSSHPAEFRGLLLAGTIIGSVSALAAVGGGFLTVTYLSYKNTSMKKAIGTSAAIGLPISIAGTFGYLLNGWSETVNNPYMLGFIYLPAFLVISITSTMMAPQGARFAQRLPDAYLKKIFAVVCVALSIKMLLSVL